MNTAEAWREACEHCGEPVLERVSAAGLAFCCQGCAGVWQVLHELGLEGYYDVLARVGETPAAPSGAPRDFAELDTPEFAARHVRCRADGTATCELWLENVHCAACVWLVEKLPHLLGGVREARLALGTGVLYLTFAAGVSPLSRIAETLARLGYPPHPHLADDRDAAARRGLRQLVLSIGVAGAAAGNAMLMALALYCGWFDGMEPEFVAFFRWGSLCVTVPAVLFAGRPFFRGAVAAWRTRTPHMDVPISVALAVGLVSGVVNTLERRGDVYFDTLATVVFLLLIGRWLQARQLRAAGNAAALLAALTPRTARRCDADGVQEVPLARLSAGDRIEVRSGDTVAADGVVEAGRSQLDLSMLTGESVPVRVDVGAAVHAGTVNVGQRLVVRITATGAATRLGQLVREVERVAAARPPIVTLADRLAGTFVLVVLSLALATLVGWAWLGGDVALGLDHAVALLIVTCPCALGMATPLAINVALGRAAQRGILIKGGVVLERLMGVQAVVLDKTGTLTCGQLRLMSWDGDTACQAAVRAMEARVNHPVAAALVRALPPGAVRLGPCEEILGGGVRAEVDGVAFVVGSGALMQAEGVLVSDAMHAAVARVCCAGASPVLVAVAGQVVAVAGLGDPLRAEAVDVVAALAQRGLSPRILSGDHASVVARVAGALKVKVEDWQAGVSPEAKLAEVRRLPTLMVGDGVNDAAALGAARVGVAMHGGAQASLAAADVFLTVPALGRLVELVDGARSTWAVIRRNLALSLAYNAVAVALAVSGHLTPLWAAVLMPLSSITVISSSYRSRTFREVP
jgi:Cu2+-exporting ATPase